MVFMTVAPKQETVNIKLRQELSEFLEQKFMCKKNCNICWNTGVRVWSNTSNSKLNYTPCSCLRLRKDINTNESVKTE